MVERVTGGTEIEISPLFPPFPWVLLTFDTVGSGVWILLGLALLRTLWVTVYGVTTRLTISALHDMAWRKWMALILEMIFHIDL